MYEVAHTYLPIKYLSTTNQQQPGCMAVSPDSALLATVSHTGPASLVSPASPGSGCTDGQSCTASPCEGLSMLFCCQHLSLQRLSVTILQPSAHEQTLRLSAVLLQLINYTAHQRQDQVEQQLCCCSLIVVSVTGLLGSVACMICMLCEQCNVVQHLLAHATPANCCESPCLFWPIT